MQYFSLSLFYTLTWPDLLKKVLSSRIRIFSTHNKRRTRILRWFGRENEDNVARTRSCCGWPSSPYSIRLWYLLFFRIFPRRYLLRPQGLEIEYEDTKVRKIIFKCYLVVGRNPHHGVNPFLSFYRLIYLLCIWLEH